MTNGSAKMYFTYDAAGRPVSIEYNGTTYYYVLNVQGDVVAIVNSSGSSVVNYTYNAWGKLCRTTGSMTSSLGSHNPLRYRGYVYDTDTQLYYLQSRYYNPEMGRFINADSYASTGQGILGNNMFAYCNNNPANMSDPTGGLAISLTVLGLIIGAVAGAIAGGVVAYNVAEENGAEGWELAGWTAAGILGGGLVGAALGAGAGGIVANATGILGFSIVNQNIFVVTETVVLGHYGYSSLATSLGYGFYQIADDLYSSMTPAQRWAMNSQFLEDCSCLGANFLVEATRTISPINLHGGISYLYYEIQYLIERGYIWLEDLSALVMG